MYSMIQWYSLLGSLLFLIIVLDAVRRQRLREAYALVWLFISGAMIVVSLWTNVLRLISNILGIAYPPATLFLILTVGILLLLFQYSIVISLHNEKLKRLTQEIALLKEKLEKKTNENFNCNSSIQRRKIHPENGGKHSFSKR